jgi:predicted nucleic acid-binding protein
VTVVLDAGALIAIDRDNPRVATLLTAAERTRTAVVTVAPVVGQAWRNGARQARLARMLHGIDVRTVTEQHARHAGELLAAAGTSDIVDALLAMIVVAGDQVLTSDPGDLTSLLAARDVDARIVLV